MSDLVLQRLMSRAEARMLNPIQLAYVGDAVHSLFVRTQLLSIPAEKQINLHRVASGIVSAHAQAKLLDRVLPELTQEETEIVQRGRNTHTHHPIPRGSTHAEYASATALEALLGYLFLTGQHQRLIELCQCWQKEDQECQKHI